MQLRQGNPIVKERVAVVLELLGDAPRLRLSIAERGGLNALILLADKGGPTAKCNAARALGALARHERCQSMINERNGICRNCGKH